MRVELGIVCNTPSAGMACAEWFFKPLQAPADFGVTGMLGRVDAKLPTKIHLHSVSQPQIANLCTSLLEQIADRKVFQPTGTVHRTSPVNRVDSRTYKKKLATMRTMRTCCYNDVMNVLFSGQGIDYK